MKNYHNVLVMILSVSAAASCGKSTKKAETEQAPPQQQTNETNDAPLKKVTKTTYPFTFGVGISSCEDIEKRIFGKTWELSVIFKNYKGLDQEEVARFVTDWVHCDSAENRVAIVAKGVDSTGFSVGFGAKFAEGAGTLQYNIDDCYAHAPDKLLNGIPADEKPLSDHDRYQVIRTTNDNFCVPAVEKLSELIVGELSL
jgi:hypothetical protein